MKKLFNNLFKKKVITAEPKLVKPKYFTKHDRDFYGKYRMKGNRLHIEYSGMGTEGRNSYFEALLSGGFKIMKVEAMYKGRIDSLRCTKLERAQQIVSGIKSYCITRAVFCNAMGDQFQII